MGCKHLSIGRGELGVKEWVQSYQQGGRELDVQVQAGPVCLLSDVLSRWTIPRAGECEPWGSANIESQLQALCDGRQERVELEGPGSPGSGAQAAEPRQQGPGSTCRTEMLGDSVQTGLIPGFELHTLPSLILFVSSW